MNKYLRRLGYAFVIVYSLIWATLTCFRADNSAFEQAETWSIWLSHEPIDSLIRYTANGVHPPLYYLLFKGAYTLFGDETFIYRMVSVVSYLLLLVLINSYVMLKWGSGNAFLMVTLLSLMPNCVTTNIESSMYEYAMLFVACTYMLMYYAIRTHKKRYYSGVAISAILAAYTHYYALLAVILIYAGMIAYSIVRYHCEQDFRRTLLKPLISLGLFIIYCTPWNGFVIKMLISKNKSEWIQSVPSVGKALIYPYDAELFITIILSAVTLFLITAVSLAFFNVVKEPFYLRVRISKEFIWWLYIGIATVILTITIGSVFSIIFKPLFTIRCMYPCIAIIWLILIACISKIKNRGAIGLLLGVLVLIVQTRPYISTIKVERLNNTRITNTFDRLGKNGALTDSLVVYNGNELTIKSLDCYFPKSKSILIDDYDNSMEIEDGLIIISEDKLGLNDLYDLIPEKMNLIDNFQGMVCTNDEYIYIAK